MFVQQWKMFEVQPQFAILGVIKLHYRARFSQNGGWEPKVLTPEVLKHRNTKYCRGPKSADKPISNLYPALKRKQNNPADNVPFTQALFCV